MLRSYLWCTEGVAVIQTESGTERSSGGQELPGKED